MLSQAFPQRGAPVDSHSAVETPPAGPDLALVMRAAVFAARVHAPHRRNGAAAEPYVNHVLEVAEILAAHAAPPAAIVAALLHDTVEDSDQDPEPCTLPQIEA